MKTNNWEREFIKIFTLNGEMKPTKPNRIRIFIRGLLRKDRERDKLHELLDFVKKSNTNTDILYRYVRNNTTCQSPRYTNMCYDLGIPVHTKEAEILAILEDYFKEHPKSE